MNKSKISVEGRKQLSREMDKKNRSGECGNHTGTTHGVFVHRGGNGTGLTRYQQALLDRLGEEWIPEFVIKINSHPYKVDLAHAERKIVIELDGTSHNMPARARQDRRKDLGLKKLGWDVIRITNAESVQLTDDLLRERVANSPVESVVFAVDPWTPDDPYVYDITVEDTHCYYADGVLVHNCQDLSPIQHWMALEASKHGRMLICGDRNQAIYGWRSAHANSMDALAAGVKSRGGGVRELQLTYTRRCPKSHVELAQRLVPRIQALDSAPQGTVLHAQTVRQLVAQAKPGDFVLSRLNASLLETAQEFWKAGKPAMVKGREAQAGVMRLYDAAMSKGAVTMRGVVANAQEIAGGEIAKFLSMPEGRGESRAQQSQDRLYCLLALAGDTYDIPVFKRRLAELFGDEADGKKVVLSTIHRAKGLESTGVHILTKKLPHPSAKEGWQREQEDNLIYVALTRGKGDAVMSFVGPDIPGCEERDNA